MPPPFSRVLLGATCTEEDGALFEYAALLARLRCAASFHVAYVLPAGFSAATGRDLAHATPAHLPFLGALSDAGRLTSSSHIGDPLDVLLQQALRIESDLLLVSQARVGGGRRPLARRLAMQAPCSVWMIPVGAPCRLDRVLAPVDLSPRSADALALATAVASAAGIDCCQVLHVRFEPSTTGYQEYEAASADNERDAFTLFAARVDWHRVDLEPILLESADVTGAILRVAAEKKADLIVMGTRGRSSAAAVVLGSETDHVLMSSSVPVLAVKHFGASLRLLDALFDQRVRTRGGPKFS